MKDNTRKGGTKGEREDIRAYQTYFCDLMTDDIERARVRIEMILSRLPESWNPTDEEAERMKAHFDLFMVQVKYFTKECEQLGQALTEKIQQGKTS